jgi:MFS family permease
MTSSTGQRRLRKLLTMGGIGIGMAVLLLGITRNIYVGIVAVALLASCCTLVGVASQSLVQMLVEDRLRGRVLSLWSLVAIGSPAIGSLLGGAMLHSVGAVATSAVFALCCFALILVVRAGLTGPRPAQGTERQEED